MEAVYIDSETLEGEAVAEQLSACDAVLVPGGFERGVGKIRAIQYTEETGTPFLVFVWVCACRCGIRPSCSGSIRPQSGVGASSNLVIELMDEQRKSSKVNHASWGLA